MITGMPSGRSFARFDAFGMCTRLTARGRHDERDWCTRTATLRPGLGSQRDLPVDPGGLAPSVALRHLPHADQRVGPAPQHQLLQVPDLRPVLLLRRLEDPLPQPPYLLLTGTPVDGVPARARLRGWSSGPFTLQPPPARFPSPAPNLPFGSSGHGRFASTAHLPTSARFRARAPGPVSGQLYAAARRRSRACCPLSCCLSAAGIRFLGILSRQGIPPPLRSAYRAASSGTDPDGVSMFRTRETRLGQGALCTPGTAVPTATGESPGRRLPLRNGQPLPPRTATRPGTYNSRGISKGSLAFTPPSLPLTCDPGRNGLLGLSPELRTPPGRTRQRTSGRGQASDTARTTSPASASLLRRTHSPRATSCRTIIQFRAPPRAMSSADAQRTTARGRMYRNRAMARPRAVS